MLSRLISLQLVFRMGFKAPLPIPKPCPEDPDTKFVGRFMSGFNWKKASRKKFQVMWIPQTLYLPCLHCQSDSAKSQVILIDKVTFHRAMFTYVIYNVQFHQSLKYSRNSSIFHYISLLSPWHAQFIFMAPKSLKSLTQSLQVHPVFSRSFCRKNWLNSRKPFLPRKSKKPKKVWKKGKSPGPKSSEPIDLVIPIGSMYGIYGNIYHQYTPNVSIYIYTIHGCYGI